MIMDLYGNICSCGVTLPLGYLADVNGFESHTNFPLVNGIPIEFEEELQIVVRRQDPRVKSQ